MSTKKENLYDEYVDAEKFTFNTLGWPRVRLLIDINNDELLDERDRMLSPKDSLKRYRPYGLGYYYRYNEDLDLHIILLENDGSAELFVMTSLYLKEDEFEFLEDAIVPGCHVIVTAAGNDNLSFPARELFKPAQVLKVGKERNQEGYITYVEIQTLKRNLAAWHEDRWTSLIEHVKLID